MSKRLGHTEPRVYTPPLRTLWPRSPITEKRTDGYRLIDFSEHVLGLKLLPWQEWLAVHALERREDGSLRFRNIVVEVARQNGKTLFSGVLALYTMYMHPRMLVLGTSATLTSAEEQWAETLEMLKEVADLKTELVKEDHTNGQKAFKVLNNSRYLVRATNRRATRGLSVDRVLMDELRECDWAGWGAATKTTTARPDGQVWSLSNAGDEQSVVLKHLRLVSHKTLGDPDGIVRAAEDGMEDEEAEDLEPDDQIAWYEWSADPRLANSDREAWAQANPGLGYGSITEATLASFYATDPEHVFSTESLCKWVLAAGPGAFPEGAWERGVDPDSRILTDSDLAFCVDMSADRAVTHIAVAGHRADGGTHVEVIASRAGVVWLPGWFEDRIEKYGGHMRVTLQERGAPISKQAEALEDIDGVEVVPWGGQDLGQGSGLFYDAVCSVNPARMVKHVPDDRLDRAAAQAAQKSLGDVWVWDRKKSAVDVAPLMAANGAWWLLHKRPEKKFRSAYEDGGLLVV